MTSSGSLAVVSLALALSKSVIALVMRSLGPLLPFYKLRCSVGSLEAVGSSVTGDDLQVTASEGPGLLGFVPGEHNDVRVVFKQADGTAPL